MNIYNFLGPRGPMPENY